MRTYKYPYPCKRYFTRLNADYLWLAMFILRLTSTQTNWYVMSFLSPALMYNWTLPANHSSWWTYSAQADSRNINIENHINCTKKRRCNLQNNCNRRCWAPNFSESTIIGAFHHFRSPSTARLGLKGQSMVFTSSELGAGELIDHNQNWQRSTVWCKRTFACISLQCFSLYLPRYADFSFSLQSNSMSPDQPTIADHYHSLANGSRFKPVSIV